MNVCPKAATATAVVVAFSEIVHTATTSAMPVTVTAGPPTGLTGRSTLEGPLVDRPQALMEWVALGRTALQLEEQYGSWAKAQTYVEQLLMERVPSVATSV